MGEDDDYETIKKIMWDKTDISELFEDRNRYEHPDDSFSAKKKDDNDFEDIDLVDAKKHINWEKRKLKKETKKGYIKREDSSPDF
jgi:hypothetical protein